MYLVHGCKTIKSKGWHTNFFPSFFQPYIASNEAALPISGCKQDLSLNKVDVLMTDDNSNSSKQTCQILYFHH